MGPMSPFGKYASLVAAIAALGIIGAWLVSALHVADVASSPELNAAALLVLGAIFGTAAGALSVTNGLGRQVASANTRLDAIDAPAATIAAAIVEHKAADAAAHLPPPAGGSG